MLCSKDMFSAWNCALKISIGFANGSAGNPADKITLNHICFV